MLCKFLSRKLIAFLMGFVAGIVLCLFGKLDATASNFIIAMTGIYLGGNVLNDLKFKNGMGEIKGKENDK